MTKSTDLNILMKYRIFASYQKIPWCLPTITVLLWATIVLISIIRGWFYLLLNFIWMEPHNLLSFVPGFMFFSGFIHVHCIRYSFLFLYSIPLCDSITICSSNLTDLGYCEWSLHEYLYISFFVHICFHRLGRNFI